MKPLAIQKTLLAICVIAACGLLLGSCSKEEPIAGQPTSDVDLSTRASAPDGHWRCNYYDSKLNRECGFYNPGWRDICLECKNAYSAGHGALLVTFFQTILKNYVDVVGGSGSSSGGGVRPEDMNDGNIGNRIIIPGGILLEYAPANWFDASKALRYYNELKDLYYYSDPAYAEGIDVGWYRTVRMLYPGISNEAKVEYAHDRWLLGDGRPMKDSRGRGLKAGTKAAITAYKNR